MDNFSNNQSLSFGPGGGAFGPLTNGPIATGGAVGGTRTMTMSGNAFPGQNVAFSAGGGVADLSSGSLSTSFGSLLYNANGAGLGNLLAGTQTVKLNLTAFNPGSGSTTISVKITDGSAVMSTQNIVLSGPTSPQTLTFNFAGSGLNFNNISSVLLSIDSSTSLGADVTVGNLVASTLPIPEPMAIAVWGAVGALGFVASRRYGLIRA
jgi:hypothetical protein